MKRTARKPGCHRNSGFTLVELLVALVISGILVAAVFQVLGGQARFSEMQSGREEVQQNARASVELISSELRSIPPQGFTIEDEGRMIRFTLPTVWGTLCSYEPGERWSRVIMPSGIIPSDSPLSHITLGRTILGFRHEAGSYSSVITGVSNHSRPQFGSCADQIAGASPDEDVPLGFQVWRIQTEQAIPADYHESAPSIFLFEQIEYTTGTSAGLNGMWLTRKRGEGGQREPLAGPLHGGVEGFKVELAPGGGGLSLSVAMQSRHQGAVQQVDSASTTVYFRHGGE